MRRRADDLPHPPRRRRGCGALRPLDGDEPVAFGDLTVIPTPGHTPGHCVLHAGPYLFSGDHLAWDVARSTLDAHCNVCWYDWTLQLQSVARLRDLGFAWLLPGHGDRIRLEPRAMQFAIDALVARC